MSRMFFDATSFNQNLCNWNEKVLDAYVRSIFYGSNCPSQHDPSLLDDGGPFCASTCIVNNGINNRDTTTNNSEGSLSRKGGGKYFLFFFASLFMMIHFW